MTSVLGVLFPEIVHVWVIFKGSTAHRIKGTDLLSTNVIPDTIKCLMYVVSLGHQNCFKIYYGYFTLIFNGFCMVSV